MKLLLVWLLLLSESGVLIADQKMVVAWGDGSRGQTGIPPGLTNVIAIAAGSQVSLALRSDGTVVGWGDDFYGQTNVPPGLTNVIAIAVGNSHSMALKSDGRVVAWGWNGEGQTNIPTSITNVVAIAAGGQHCLALKADGRVAGWGANYDHQIDDQGLQDAVGIAAGNSHSLALTRDGSVVAWGGNFYGQRSLPAGLTNVVAIAAGLLHSLALKSNGTVVGWGQYVYGQTDVPDQITNAIGIAAGFRHSFALNGDGTVLGWGDNSNGQIGVPPDLREVEALAGGSEHTLALRAVRMTVLVDGVRVQSERAITREHAEITLFSPFASSTILFTLDGSDPSVSGRLYDSRFVVTQSVTLRAIAYSADFTQAVQPDPLEIVVVPTLTATAEGGGSVMVCPPSGAYFSNSLGIVTATPAPGWTFLQWLGDASGTNPAATVSMTRNKCVQAVFGTTVSNTVVGSGSVVSSPSRAWYPYGSTVWLTAVPQTGNYFALWGNAASGTNNPHSFPVTNANPVVTAVFAALGGGSFALTAIPNGFGQVSASPRASRYSSGANVTLTAMPEAGQSFVNWSGDASGTNNPLVVTMNQSKVITANFTKRPRLSPVGCGGLFNDEEIQLVLSGEFGERYVIEATSELAPGATFWAPVGTVTNSFGVVQLNDPFVTNRTQRFYRAVQ